MTVACPLLRETLMRACDLNTDEIAISIERWVVAPEAVWKKAIHRLYEKWFFGKGQTETKGENPLSTQNLERAFCQLTEIREALRPKLSEPIKSHSGETSSQAAAKPDELFQMGRDLFAKKNYKVAYSIFDSLLKVPETIQSKSRFIEVLLCAASSALFCQQYARGMELANSILVLSPDHPQAYVIRALLFREKGEWRSALENIEKANQLKPQSEAIEKYRTQILKEIASTPSSELMGVLRRKWIRGPATGLMLVNDHMTSGYLTFKLKSLSAGGCLVEGADALPSSFQFSLCIDGDPERIWGEGSKLYDVQGKQIGIAFRDISKRNQLKIDRFIRTKQTLPGQN